MEIGDILLGNPKTDQYSKELAKLLLLMITLQNVEGRQVSSGQLLDHRQLGHLPAGHAIVQKLAQHI
jgi:hypothetical protein